MFRSLKSAPGVSNVNRSIDELYVDYLIHGCDSRFRIFYRDEDYMACAETMQFIHDVHAQFEDCCSAHIMSALGSLIRNNLNTEQNRRALIALLNRDNNLGADIANSLDVLASRGTTLLNQSNFDRLMIEIVHPKYRVKSMSKTLHQRLQFDKSYASKDEESLAFQKKFNNIFSIQPLMAGFHRRTGARSVFANAKQHYPGIFDVQVVKIIDGLVTGKSHKIQPK